MPNSLYLQKKSNKPKIMIVTALLLFVAGVFITPNLLISLGPMRIALTSEIQSARNMAYLEVYLFRIGCVVLSILMFVTAFKWK